MKKIWASLAIVLFSGVSAMAQQGAKFQFKDKNDTYDFGTVKEGAKVEHNFEFTNVGNQPLIILKAEAGCSCTMADWPKTPIAPGKTGAIKVTFNSEGKPGPAIKEITIKSNAVLPKPTMQRYSITLKGTVDKK
ncbi:MAG: DUF1573 domain-containing protein [Edaphocola sp.]